MASRPSSNDTLRSAGKQTTTRLVPEVGAAPTRDPACVVVVNGPQLGMEARVDDTPLLVGRAEECGLVLGDASVSRRHCRIFREAHGFVVEDLGSTNGCAINGRRVDRAELRDGDRLRIGHCELKFFGVGSAEASYHRELLNRAVFDALTGLYNRRQFRELLEHAFDRGRSDGGCRLQLMILDLDHFKPVNDRHGHLAGDRVLAGFAALLREMLPRGMVSGRLGGEEFAAFADGIDAAEFNAIAEGFRLRLADTPMAIEEGELRITVSIGIGAQTPEMRAAADLLRTADNALYRAKLEGRNRVLRAGA